MTINLERIKRIDQLIRLRSTGTPKELSKKLCISERLVYNYILKMKTLGAPIEYCHESQSYIYSVFTSFECQFQKNEE
jgi:predicted DNA-binding transcriptional regulator YafY